MTVFANIAGGVGREKIIDELFISKFVSIIGVDIVVSNGAPQDTKILQIDPSANRRLYLPTGESVGKYQNFFFPVFYFL